MYGVKRAKCCLHHAYYPLTNWILANGQLSSSSYYYLPWVPDIFFLFAADWFSVGHRWTGLQLKPKAISGKAARKNLWYRGIPFTIPIKLWSFLLYHIYFEPIRSNVSHCDHMDCCPPSCLLDFFTMFSAIISPSSSVVLTLETSEMSTIFFFFTSKTTQPRPQVFSVTVP